MTHAAILAHLAAVGFNPSAVYDVGAFKGEWARLARSYFPTAPIGMVEGNPACFGHLREVAREIFADVFPVVVGFPCASRPFHVLTSGSSLYRELNPLEPRAMLVDVRSLDDVTKFYSRCHPSAPPGLGTGELLKLDTQGSELEILGAAPLRLGMAEVIVIECSLLRYNAGAPSIQDVMNFMSIHGFAPYDVGEQFRRVDGTLFQLDVVFVRAGSSLRRAAPFMTPEALAQTQAEVAEARW